MKNLKQISKVRSVIESGIKKLEASGVTSPKSSSGAFGGTTVKVSETPVGLATISRHSSGHVSLDINGEPVFDSTYGGGEYHDEGGWSYAKWCGGFKKALYRYSMLMKAIS